MEPGFAVLNRTSPKSPPPPPPPPPPPGAPPPPPPPAAAPPIRFAEVEPRESPPLATEREDEPDGLLLPGLLTREVDACRAADWPEPDWSAEEATVPSEDV